MKLDNKLDNNYKKDKKTYEKVEKLKQSIEKAKESIKKYTRQKEDAEKNKERAIEDKDKTAEKNAEVAIKLIDEEIKKEKEKLTKMEKVLNDSKEKVDSYIKELSKDPEFKAHINSILEKRYNRNIKKSIAEKAQIDLIINLCKEHPSLENNLKGMISAREKTEKFDEELKTLDPVKDKTRIDQIKNVEIPTLMSKKSMNEKSFMDFCTKNNINIDKEFLQKLIDEKEFAHDKKTKEVLISKTLKNTSKGYEKRINAYKKSIEKIPGAKIYEENRKENTQTGDSKESILPREKKEQEEYEEDNSEENKLPANKFKWWQFGKRFNAWKERRNIKKEEKQKQNEGKTQESSKKFRDAYKYEVVQDYVEKLESAIQKEVYRESKKQDKEEER